MQNEKKKKSLRRLPVTEKMMTFATCCLSGSDALQPSVVSRHRFELCVCREGSEGECGTVREIYKKGFGGGFK